MSGADNQEPDGAHKWHIFLLVAAGVFLATMDSSMVNVALPSIMRDFSATLIEVQWVVLIYLLTITVTLLLWGIGADWFGKQPVYLGGVTVFGVGCLACSQAPTLPLLVVCRCVEGLGAAMMMSAGPAIIRDVFPRRQLGRGLGLIGIATSLGLMSGPAVSGLLVSAFSWRAIFLVTVPLSVCMLPVGLRVLNRSTMITPASRTRTFDGKGAVLWSALVISFILYAHFLSSLPVVAVITGATWLMLLVLLFIWAEKTRNSTILPLHLFGKRYYHIGLITAATSFGALFVVLILMPFYLDYVKGMRADTIGLVMMAVPVTLCVVSPTAGMLYDRMGSRYLTTAGLGLCFGALMLLTGIDRDSGLVDICARLALLGMGQSMFLSPNTASLLARIQDEDVSITAGLLATARNLGMLAGAAFASIVFAAWFSRFSGGLELRTYRPEQAALFVASLRATFFCTAVISLIAAVLSWQRGR